MTHDDLTPTPIINDEKTEEMGIEMLAMANGLNRRIAERINYPKIPAGPPYPQLDLHNKTLSLTDISSGGFALNAIETSIVISVGDEVRINISWPGVSVAKRATMLNASSEKYHFKWCESFPELEEWLNPLQLSATLGGRISRVYSHLKDVVLDAEEIWQGPTGELLIFYTLGAGGRSDVFFKWGDREAVIQWNPFQIHTDRTSLTTVELSQWIILLGQISTPSVHLSKLIFALSSVYKRLINSGVKIYG